jgi:hypothetical protein
VQDRRDQVRKSAHQTFVVYDADSDEPIGLLINLTTHGAKMVSHDAIEVPKKVHCRMALPREILGRDVVRFDAEIRWCQWSERTGMFETGCEFSHVEDVDMKVIAALVRDWPISEERSARVGKTTSESR